MDSNRTIIVMLSGGIDSTYTLWHCLTQLENPVHAYHVSLRSNGFHRHNLEDQAVEDVIEYCTEHCRSFTSSQGRADLDFLLRDADLLWVMGFQVAASMVGTPTVLACGHVREDIGTMRSASALMLELLVEKYPKVDVLPQTYRPAERLYKRQLFERLPRDLSKLTWGCRNPQWVNQGWLECGRCGTCKQLQKIKRD